MRIVVSVTQPVGERAEVISSCVMGTAKGEVIWCVRLGVEGVGTWVLGCCFCLYLCFVERNKIS